jgi:hypothetical protein
MRRCPARVRYLLKSGHRSFLVGHRIGRPFAGLIGSSKGRDHAKDGDSSTEKGLAATFCALGARREIVATRRIRRGGVYEEEVEAVLRRGHYKAASLFKSKNSYSSSRKANE